MPPILSNSASTDEAGTLKRTNVSKFLDNVYQNDRDVSPILTFNRRIFDPQILNQGDSWFFSGLKIHRDFTLLSYYGDGDYYKSHTDSCVCTALTWLHREPKEFKGGDLIFPDHEVTVQCKNNRVLIFPAMINHEVLKIEPVGESLRAGFGRWCITQFMHVSPIL